jgi:hypothetical protein
MAECKKCNSRNVKKTENQFHDIFDCEDCNTTTFNKIEDCCRQPSERYVDGFHNGVPVFIRVQCDNCGGCLNMTKSLDRATYGNKTRGEFSQDRFDKWKIEKQIENQSIYKTVKYLKDAKVSFFQYDIYLQSKHWRSLRLVALERDKWVCQLCKLETATEVHHLTYKNLGNELLEELTSYCRACHEKVHEK